MTYSSETKFGYGGYVGGSWYNYRRNGTMQ